MDGDNIIEGEGILDIGGVFKLRWVETTEEEEIDWCRYIDVKVVISNV